MTDDDESWWAMRMTSDADARRWMRMGDYNAYNKLAGKHEETWRDEEEQKEYIKSIIAPV